MLRKVYGRLFSDSADRAWLASPCKEKKPICLSKIVMDVVGNSFLVKTDYWKNLAEMKVFE